MLGKRRKQGLFRLGDQCWECGSDTHHRCGLRQVASPPEPVFSLAPWALQAIGKILGEDRDTPRVLGHWRCSAKGDVVMTTVAEGEEGMKGAFELLVVEGTEFLKV